MRTKQETTDILIREYIRATQAIGMLKDTEKPLLKPYAEGYAEGLLSALAIMKEMSTPEAEEYAMKEYAKWSEGLNL